MGFVRRERGAAAISFPTRLHELIESARTCRRLEAHVHHGIQTLDELASAVTHRTAFRSH